MPFVASLFIYLSKKLHTKQCSRSKLCEQCIHRYVKIVNLASQLYCSQGQNKCRCTSFKDRLKKKQSRNVHFFFADSLSFDFNFKTATSECLPHHSFTSKHLHEYPLLFSDFRLDFLIGLQIKFDVHHRIIQKQLILQVRRLKNALCRFSIDVSFEQTAYEVVFNSETL